MGLFGSFIRSFGKKDNDGDGPRQLNHPRDLQVGDIVKFGFTPLQGISNESFTVKQIFTHDLGDPRKNQTFFQLQGADSYHRLRVGEERGIEFVELSLAVFPETVEQIFDIEAFGAIFEGDSVNHQLQRIAEPDAVSGWTAPLYRQESAQQAYAYKGDYRNTAIPSELGGAEEFDYYVLVSDARKHSVRMEVYDGGRTDVFLNARLDDSAIDELWAAGQ